MRQTTNPIFIVGRQHCGNTMLVQILANCPEVLTFDGESTFWEHQSAMKNYSVEKRISKIIDIEHEVDSKTFNKAWCVDFKEKFLSSVEAANNRISAEFIYRRMHEAIVQEHPAVTHWAQKGTSYIFYVEKILRAFPSAKLIFLYRNPCEVAGSYKRRKENIVRGLWGWRKGMSLAEKYVLKYPDKIMMSCYDRILNDPEKEVERIFNFAGLKFDKRYLDIPVVNPSEKPYALEGPIKGIKKENKEKYAGFLTPAEMSLAALIASHSFLKKYFPDKEVPQIKIDFELINLLLRQSANVAKIQMLSIFRSPGYTINRILVRLVRGKV